MSRKYFDGTDRIETKKKKIRKPIFKNNSGSTEIDTLLP